MTRALIYILVAALTVLSTLVGRTQATPPGHRYVLEAELDPERHVVDGKARIHWSNQSEVPVRELYLHLYLNAFESDRTVFMRETRGALRGIEAHGTGRIEVLTFRDGEGRDLLPRARTDLEPEDRTQMRVDLPSPIAPGETIELEIRFRSHLPPLFARSGYVGSFHVVAQWYPKLARLERDGSWATFPYRGLGEFYADFAHYDLTIRAPTHWVIGATGREVDRMRGPDEQTIRFVASPVHDAVFVAWPHFEEMMERIEGVDVRWLSPPGHRLALKIHRSVVESGLRRFGRLYGGYPYPTLTVVVPPREAAGGAAMEYPTLFLTRGPWFPLPGVRVGMQAEITAHELAHQWFQGIVATDEVKWPMLDEGLATYASWDLLRTMHGRDRSAIGLPGLEVDAFELMRSYSLRAREPVPPPGRPAHTFTPYQYGRAVYARPALLLETLRRALGTKRLERALGDYARTHRFEHPGPEDLFSAFDREYGHGFARRVLEPTLMEGEHASIRMTDVRSPSPEQPGRVVARRIGRVAFPTEIELRSRGTKAERIPWPAGRARFEERVDAPILGAIADPEAAIVLDPSVLDSARAAPSAPRPRRVLLSRWLALLQTILGGVLS